jgi:hypothetical protein
MILTTLNWINSAMYDVCFPDSDVKEFTANNSTISENLMNQIDHEGFSKKIQNLLYSGRIYSISTTGARLSQ